MRGQVLLGMTAALMLLSPGARAAGPPEDQLEKAESEFRQQRYRRTVALLHPLLHPVPSLKSVDDVHRAREMLGASYWEVDEKPKARNEWHLLLRERPGFKLDEFYYPAAMRADFDALRKDLIARGLIRDVNGQPKPTKIKTLLRIKTVRQQSRATAFIPFGVGQFEADSNTWGWFFFSSQTATLAAMIGTSLAYQLLPGYPDFPNRDERSTANALYLTSIVTGAVFAGLAVWGIIDANVRFKPSRVIEDRVVEVPAETVDGRPPQPGANPLPAAGGSR